MFIIAVILGFLIALIKVLRIPHPKETLNKSEIHDYYFNNGWKTYERKKETEKQIAMIEKERMENKIYNALDTLAHLENQKEQLHNIYKRKEYELNRETDPKKQTAIYNQLRILDDKIFNIDRKIKQIIDI